MVVHVLVALVALCLPTTEGARYHAQSHTLRTARGGGGARQQRRNNNQKPKEVSFEGTIQKVGSAGMSVLSDKDQAVWLVAGSANTKVTTTGTAELSFLAAKMIVEIKAAVDADGFVKGKLGQIKLVGMPSDKLPASAMPAPAAKGGATNDAAKTLAKAGAKSDTSFAKEKEKDGDTAAAGPATTLIGHLSGIKGTQLTMQVATSGKGHRVVQFELAEDAKIDVALPEATVARPGDKVEIKGKEPPGTPNACVAEEVKVTLTTPLTGKKKFAAKSSGSSKSSNSSDKEKEKASDGKDSSN